ncbi:MAG: RNA polymerase sigma factor [Deltaproteobacteria bacterium]|nr:RNA polymerase sigma factor [Deltaproteobacteria bacterium]MCX7952857.1 RNA polymerase sigma factor [Deltaproteobacteria bacterium]
MKHTNNLKTKKSMALNVEHLKDTQLIKLFLQGLDAPFVELVRRYKHKVRQLAYRITRSVEDAEDVVQEVFMTVFLKLKDFEGKSAFSSWLYRITFNASLMKLRKDKVNRLNSALDSVEEVKISMEQSKEFKTEDCQELAELRQIILSAVEKLPPQYRQIVVLGDMQNLTHDEIADITGLTVSAIKSRLHRARLMLKKRLKYVLTDTPKKFIQGSVYC